MIFVLAIPVISVSQNNVFDEVHFNSDYYKTNSDTLEISINLNPEHAIIAPNDTLVGFEISFTPPWTKENNNIHTDKRLVNVIVYSQNEVFNNYEIEIPVSALPLQKCIFDVIAKFKHNNIINNISYSTESGENLYIYNGESGFNHIQTNIGINNDNKNFLITSFDNKFQPVPDYLEGVYSTGFCKDEVLKIDNFLMNLWSDKTCIPKLFTFYSIDNEEFNIVSNIKELDNSSDNNIHLNDENYAISSNIGINEYVFEIETGLSDILKKLDTKESGHHNIRFYFEFTGKNKIERFPESNFITINFEVVSDALGPNCQAALLPIDLLDWNAFKQDKSVHLSWKTANEVNNDYFEIERSKDGKTWGVIEKIKGKGNTFSENKYYTRDNFPLEGLNFYRLTQTDFDGSKKYSRYKEVYNFENELILYPNPVGNILSYSIKDKNRKFKLEIFESTGKLVYTCKIPEPGSNDFNIDISHLNCGTYIVKYINLDNSRTEILKLVKI